MAVLTRRNSDVRINELDLSTIIGGASPASAAIGVVSAKGPTRATFYSNPEDFKFDFGDPNSKISFDHYAALDYLREGNSLWAIRALGTDYYYSAALVYIDSLNTTIIQGITSGPVGSGGTSTSGISDPANADMDAMVMAGETPLFLFYPRQGPGSFGDNIAIEILSNNVDSPQNLNGTTNTLNGNLAAATYEYVVTAVSESGETLASAPLSVVVGSATTTNTITVSWDAVPNAIGYRIYGRSSGSLGFISQVGGATYSFLDTGSIIPDLLTIPPTTVPTPIETFRIRIYDTTISTSKPQEDFTCSLTEQTDETGAQMEVTQRVNPFSRYVRVESNIPNLLSTPTIKSASMVNLAGGDSGTAPTSADVLAAMQIFLNKESYTIDMFINGGRTATAYQRGLDALSYARNDCHAILDVPPSLQGAQDAVDYRKLTLNLNSSYSTLITPDLMEMDPISGKLLYVPPSGAIAGLQARTSKMTQPWFSIAGLNRGILNSNVLDIREVYDEGKATLLFQNQVSYIRKFQGRGMAFWESMTLYNKNSALQFLNIRVLCNIIKRAVYSYLLYSLQEPGDDLLRKQIQFGLEDYLRTVQAGRGIRRFQVVINESNNPPSFVNSGVLAVGIVIVPIIAVREIQVTLAIGKEGVNITEAELAGA